MANHEATEEFFNFLEVHFWAQGIFPRQFCPDGDTRQKGSWGVDTLSDPSFILGT